jgi:hypothetical protein
MTIYGLPASQETTPLRPATLQDVLDSERKFWLPETVEGGLETLLHLEQTEQLRQPYPGLFWRGAQSRFGMPNPPLEILLSVILPKGGWGYTKYSGANNLGLSTQIPKNAMVATPHVPPYGPPKWVEFTHRPSYAGRARHKLNKYEVTLLEVLDDLIEDRGYSEVPLKEALEILKEGLRMRTEIGIAVVPRLLSGSLSEPPPVKQMLQQLIFH